MQTGVESVNLEKNVRKNKKLIFLQVTLRQTLGCWCGHTRSSAKTKFRTFVWTKYLGMDN